MHNVLGYYQMSETRACRKVTWANETIIRNHNPCKYYLSIWIAQMSEITARRKITWAYETILSRVRNQSLHEYYLSIQIAQCVMNLLSVETERSTIVEKSKKC